MKVFYLGPPKTFSERAAEILSRDVRIPEPNFQRVALQTAQTPGAGGVLPYYNLLEGLIQESLDLIYEYKFTIHNACRVPVELCIGGFEGKTIHSHTKALAQCSDYLGENFPEAALLPEASTADAARLVRAAGRGMAIASRAALAEQGLDVLEADIGNRRHGRRNFTDFLLVSADPAPPAGEGPFRTMVAITPPTDRVGLLAEILSVIRENHLNIAKIHSRPAIDLVEMAIEPQMFYLEIMSDRKDIQALTDAFGENTVRILGSFPALGNS